MWVVSLDQKSNLSPPPINPPPPLLHPSSLSLIFLKELISPSLSVFHLPPPPPFPPPPLPTPSPQSATWAGFRSLRPKIHGYTRCKRTGFVKPDSVKLAKGHLLQDEAGPWNLALQTPVPPWIQGLVCGVPCGWSVAVDPLSATAAPLHLTQFAVPLF